MEIPHTNDNKLSGNNESVKKKNKNLKALKCLSLNIQNGHKKDRVDLCLHTKSYKSQCYLKKKVYKQVLQKKIEAL